LLALFQFVEVSKSYASKAQSVRATLMIKLAHTFASFFLLSSGL
jgi:hypothetical protein